MCVLFFRGRGGERGAEAVSGVWRADGATPQPDRRVGRLFVHRQNMMKTGSLQFTPGSSQYLPIFTLRRWSFPHRYFYMDLISYPCHFTRIFIATPSFLHIYLDQISHPHLTHWGTLYYHFTRVFTSRRQFPSHSSIYLLSPNYFSVHVNHLGSFNTLFTSLSICFDQHSTAYHNLDHT